MRALWSVLILLAIAGCCAGQDGQAVINGRVYDAKNETRGIADMTVEVTASNDPTTVVASIRTDSRGYYSTTVPSGKLYDIWIRDVNPNPQQRTPSVVKDGDTSTFNFRVDIQSSYQNIILEKYGYWIVIAVAALVLAAIILDQMLLHRKSKGPGLAELKRQRDQMQEMVNLAKSKYHKREIDEESFREITRDQQEKLIEVESKIRELEGK